MPAEPKRHSAAWDLIPDRPTLRSLSAAAAGCRACELWERGSRTVFGEGAAHAEVMLVGEQPGDREDVEGRPFVGPAGRLLDRGLDEAGIDRADVYVTNVVKHFNWEPRGKRRIHRKPNAEHIAACRPWLQAELAVVKPKVLVCLGATAAQAIIGRQFRLTQHRGEFVDTDLEPMVTATVHPSSILRAPDDRSRHEAMRAFVADLRGVARVLRAGEGRRVSYRLMPVVAAFGTWRSPVSAEAVARGAVPLLTCLPAGDGVAWLEGRPTEGGRVVLVRRDAEGRVADLTPPGFSVRTRVHEYGGLPVTVRGDEVVFSNDADQRLYRQPLGGGEPVAITPEPPAPMAHRFADLEWTPDGVRIFCVRERHEADGVWNELVCLPPDGSSEPAVVTSGNDFYSSPRVSPDGRSLAWLTWNHPNMPWDGTELWVGSLNADGAVTDSRPVAGGPTESVFQPSWSPDGVLHFVSDPTGWWNLYRLPGAGADPDPKPQPLMEMEAEFGVPQWLLGASTYSFLDDETIVCVYQREGRPHLAALRTEEGRLEDLDVAYSSYGFTVRTEGGKLYFVGGTPSEPAAATVLDLSTGLAEILRGSFDLDLDPGWVSVARPISFATGGGTTAHALFYPPANPDFTGPEDERPPLLVLSHGGPTSHASASVMLPIQFWTSRGFAVVDVNYRGSTGYGRAYRDALEGQWGVADVEDCVNAALFLAETGEVDGKRLAIRGGSAGGYTTLCALTFRDEFSAGASYFGVGDLEALARDTHKFESRYLDSLVGPYPQAIDLYRERSPIHHVDRISTPVILFQGLEDMVVPPNQAEDMVAALRRNGIPVAYLAFEGEQHGFRRAETNRRCLEAELYFYSKVFGFELSEEIEPVEIENLPVTGSNGPPG